MKIEIRRYHILILAAAVNLSAAVYIFSRENVPALETVLVETAPPLPAVQPPLPAVPAAPLLSPPVAATRPKARPKENAPPSPWASSAQAPGRKWIALTFDDGPHPRMTERLLAILNECGVPATFFVVGKQVERHPELLQRISRSGHEIANHSYTHRNLKTLSKRDLEQELDKTDKLIESITQQRTRYFRPPGGQYDERILGQARDMGYELVLWTILPQDHAHPSADVIHDRVLANARGSDIVLLHSGIGNTLAALPRMIADLKGRGYQFLTVSELRARAGSLPETNLARAQTHPGR